MEALNFWILKICLLNEIPGNSTAFFSKLGLLDVNGIVIDDSVKLDLETSKSKKNALPLGDEQKKKNKLMKNRSTVLEESGPKRKAVELLEDPFVRKIKRKID